MKIDVVKAYEMNQSLIPCWYDIAMTMYIYEVWGIGVIVLNFSWSLYHFVVVTDEQCLKCYNAFWLVCPCPTVGDLQISIENI